MKRFLMSNAAVPVVAVVAGLLSVAATLAITGRLGFDVHREAERRPPPAQPSVSDESKDGTAFPAHPSAANGPRVRYAPSGSRTAYEDDDLSEYYRQYFGYDDDEEEEEGVVVTAPPEERGSGGQPGEPGQPGIPDDEEGGDEGDGTGGEGGPGGDPGVGP